MTITRIRGGQVQDRTIQAVKIATGTLTDNEISSSAAIGESKLSINWHNHTETLSDKKILNYVQINPQAVGGLSSLDVTSIVGATTPTGSSTDTTEGIIIDSPKNQVIIIDSSNGDPVLDSSNKQVYGRMTYVASSTPANGGTFTIDFLTTDANGNEIAFTMPSGMNASFNYIRRFNLLTVDEMFAANEKFVDGSADANARLDLQQLAEDLYGASWSLDHDGQSNLATSVVDQILQQTSGVTNTAVRASTIIDEVVAGRGTYSDLKSRLDANDTAVTDVNNEVVNARTNAASTPVTYSNLKARLDAMDSSINSVTNGGSSTQTEVTDARVTSVAVDGSGASITESSLENRLVADFSATVQKVTDLTNNLASTSANEGASLIGVQDAANNFTATTVEAVLAEIQNNLNTEKSNLASYTSGQGAALIGTSGTFGASQNLTNQTVEAVLEDLQSRLVNQEQNGGAEVTATHTRPATTNSFYSAATFSSLEARLESGESIADAQFQLAKNTETEVTNARTNAASTPVVYSTLKDRLDAADTALNDEITNRTDADTAIRNDFASTAAGKGSDLVGVTSANFSANSTVTNALDDLYNKYVNVDDEVVNARTNAAATPVVFSNLKDRLDNADSNFNALDSEVVTARGSMSTLDDRLNVSLNANGTLVNGTQLHTHHKYIDQVTVQKSVENMPSGQYFQNDGTLNVYVNGVLQANGVNFTENYDAQGRGVSVDFGSDPLLVGDVCVMTWVSNNAQ